MKIIIEHSKTKREIQGAFNICGNREDLRFVARHILDVVDINDNFYYGWINIPSKIQESIINTSPKGWD